MKFKERLDRFFSGRYGYDDLNLFILILYLIIIIIRLITKCYWLDILEFITVLILITRILSKNIEKRRAENRKFQKISAPVRTWLYNTFKNRNSSHKIFVCPNCLQKVRVPKGKGKIEITCPKCRNSFVKRS